MWKNRIIGYEEVDPEQLLANPRNWRIHPQSQQEALEGVLDEVGWVDDIIVNQRTGFVLDGHLRVALAISQNQKTVPIKYIDVTEDEEMLLLATFDPITAMAVADKEVLEELMTGIDSDNERIQGLLDDIAKREGIELETKEAPEAQIDRADELQKKWKVKRGQIWKIGRHRLMCGDSTINNDVLKMVQGREIDMIFTDPPFAVFGSSTGVSSDHTDSKIVEPFFRLCFGLFSNIIKFFGHVYVWCDFRTYPIIYQLLSDANLKIKNCIVWDKGQVGPGYFFQNVHEFIAFSIKEPNQKVFAKKSGHRPVHGIPNIWSFTRSTKFHETEHRAEKPVELCAKGISASSEKDEIVADLFLGSGTTMVAAEQLNRICYGMEIEPKYCAVTLERMSDMGLKPKLVDTKKV